jgi:hypothetical protein
LIFCGGNREIPHIEHTVSSPTLTAKSKPAENDRLLTVTGIAIATILGQAVWFNNGALHPTAILYVAVSIAIATIATIGSGKSSIQVPMWAPCLVLWAALGIQFVLLQLASPGVYIAASGPHWQIFSAVLAASTFLAGGALSNTPGFARSCFALGLLAFVFLAIWVVQFSPSPPIDVFGFQTEAAKALLGRSNPYEIRTANIYGHAHFYGPGVVRDGVLQFGFPYFPLSLLAVIPGQLLGDPRFAQILFIAATGLIFIRLQPGPLGRGIALLYLFSPRTLFVIEQSWTEPLLVLLTSLVALASKTNPRAVAPAFGFLLAAKQTMVWMPFLFPLLVPGKFLLRVRALGIALGIACLITLPFFLWNPQEFWRSVVEWQFIQPFRRDALSFAALFLEMTGTTFPAYLPFLASAACIALALWKSSRSTAGWAMSACLVYLVFFALNKQAFCNYYFMVVGLACLAAASVSVSDSADREEARKA